MVARGANRREAHDPFGRNVEETAPALVGDADYICVDCDARQVELLARCPSCGGVVVERSALQETEYDPLIGRKIGGRFTIIARLGAGSMGAVYRARQDAMSRDVALKVLKPERAFDAGAKARFEREARATSALTSPHTVTVYDFGEDDSTPQGAILYLAMERLDGESLGQRIKRVGRIAPNDAVRIAKETLQSLAEAHEKGVVHRDLKPDNIFLHRIPTPHGLQELVKVLDFGIAKILQPDLKVDSLETQAGTVFGTPRYMSPEQAQSKPLDGRSDLYTVGLILFQMVTGRHVFPDEDAVVVMARHIQSLPPRPREVAPDAGISRKLEALILRTLSKDPKRRPQSAQELHDELSLVLADSQEFPESASMPVAVQTGSLPPSAATGELTLPTSPRPLRTLLIAAGVLALVGVAVGIGFGLARRPPPVVVNDTSESRPVRRVKEEVDPSPAAERRVDPVEPALAPPPSVKVSTAPSTSTLPTIAVGSKIKPAPVASKPEPSASVLVVAPTPPPTASPSTTVKKPTYGKFD